MKNFVYKLEQAIFSIRWFLVPMYLGMFVALCLYIWHFISEIVEMIRVQIISEGIQEATGQALMLGVLELIDMTMIANLIVMTIQGGYSIFVREFDYDRLHGRPRWLSADFSSSEQKIKLGMSIIGVIIVQLLHDFIQSSTVTWSDLGIRLSILGSVIIATLAFCIYNILMHSGHSKGSKHAETH